MASTRRLSKALKSVAPEAADKLKRAGLKARDARRRDADPDVDEAVTSHIAATLRKQSREDPVRGLTIAQKAAQRAANKVVAEFDVSPADRAKMEKYHDDRVAALEAQGPNESSDGVWDVKAESLARRARNEVLQKAARATEDEAKADWVKLTGGKKLLGLGFRGHGREEAGRDAPLEPDFAADAAQLATFRERLKASAVPRLNPEATFDPLAGHVSPRERRKDDRASRKVSDNPPSVDSEADGEALGAEKAAPTMVEKVARQEQKKRDKPTTKPNIARGGCGGNQR